MVAVVSLFLYVQYGVIYTKFFIYFMARSFESFCVTWISSNILEMHLILNDVSSFKILIRNTKFEQRNIFSILTQARDA